MGYMVEAFHELKGVESLRWIAALLLLLVSTGVGFCMVFYYWLEYKFGLGVQEYGLALLTMILSSAIMLYISSNYWTVVTPERDVLKICLLVTGGLMLVLGYSISSWEVFIICAFAGIGTNTIVV